MSGVILYHNFLFLAFYRPTLFEFDSSLASKDDDTYHFVSYIPIEGRLYELDGLKQGPIDLGAIPAGTDWFSYVKPILENRMKK